MKWPPYLLKMRFQNRRHAFTWWLPLFLIGPIVLAFLLAIFLVLLPFALLAVLFTWESGWLCSMLLGVPALFRLFCHLPGLKVDVGGSEGQVYVEFL
jgi:hypothetical protein